MKRLICWWEGFAETWLDPAMWKFHLLGPSVKVSGHLHDLDKRFWRIEGDRELEFCPCARCGQVLFEGWRPINLNVRVSVTPTSAAVADRLAQWAEKLDKSALI